MRRKLLWAAVAVTVGAIAVAAYSAGGVNAAGETNGGSGSRAPSLTKSKGAFAQVSGVALTRSQGFTAIDRPSTGVYCLTPAKGINVVDAAPIASIEWFNSTGFDLFVEPLRTVFDCPAGTLEVRTYTLGGDATPDLSNNVAFSVFLPKSK